MSSEYYKKKAAEDYAKGIDEFQKAYYAGSDVLQGRSSAVRDYGAVGGGIKAAGGFAKGIPVIGDVLGTILTVSGDITSAAGHAADAGFLEEDEAEALKLTTSLLSQIGKRIPSASPVDEDGVVLDDEGVPVGETAPVVLGGDTVSGSGRGIPE